MSYLLHISAFIWLFISVMFFGLGEYLSKKWGFHPSISMTVFVVIAYACSTLTWLPILLHKNSITIMGSMWLLLATLFMVFVGMVIFKESVNAYQIFGIILAIIAMLLLNIE